MYLIFDECNHMNHLSSYIGNIFKKIAENEIKFKWLQDLPKEHVV